jgi:hypothetical protein
MFMNKNNLFRFLMIFPLVALTFATCKEEDETVTSSLSIIEADKTQAFEIAGGSKTIVVTATAAFTAVVEVDKDWCTVSDVTESLFKLNVTKNTDAPRTAIVTLSLEGAPDVEITVTQAAEDAALLINPRMFHFDSPAAAERTATVTTNRSTYTATVETGKTWVTTEINGASLKVKVEESKVEAEREAKIIVHVDGATDVELHVTQAAYVLPVPITTQTAQWNVATPGSIN